MHHLTNLLLALATLRSASAAAVAPGSVPTTPDPATIPELKSSRVLISNWTEEGGVEAFLYGYGGQVDIPVTTLDNGTTIYEKIWKNGTGLELIGVEAYYDYEDDIAGPPSTNGTDAGQKLKSRMVSLAEGELHARACKRSCKRNINYWSQTIDQGTWWPAFQRTDYHAYNGGYSGLCDSIIVLPTFSGSIGLDKSLSFGVLSGALGIAPQGGTAQSRCYGCTAPRNGCARLYTQVQKHWKNAYIWRRDEQFDDGRNACSICNREWSNTENLGQVNANWPVVNSDGWMVVVAKCGDC